MTGPRPLMPRQPVPALDLPIAGGGRHVSAQRTPDNFTLIVFYRGLHCPICGRYLKELAGLKDAFAERGVSLLVVSTDTRERAEQAKTDWGLDGIDVAYGLGLEEARDWGLYISGSRGKTSIGIVEPDLFTEPGLFLVRADGTLYYGSVQTMPFARPSFRDLLGAVDFALKNDYPARGHVVDHTNPVARRGAA